MTTLKPTVNVKPIKIPKPKIASIHIAKLPGGFKLQHAMTHGPQPVPFVFTDPKKMMSHLKRIQASEWREPERDPASGIEKSINTAW